MHPLIIRRVNTASISRHLFAYIMGVQLLFGSLSALNRLGLTFFYYYPRMIEITIFGSRVDLLVWIASALCVSLLLVTVLPQRNERKVIQVSMAVLTAVLGLFLLVTIRNSGINWSIYLLFFTGCADFTLMVLFQDRIFEQSSKSFIALTFIYVFAFLATIEASAAVHYLFQAFDVSTAIASQDAGIELQLSYAAYGLIPSLYVAFLFSWAWVPVALKLSSRSILPSRVGDGNEVMGDDQNGPSLRSRWSMLLDPKLLLVVAVAVVIGYYPYFQNPPWIVGTDAYWRYYDPLVRLSASGPFGAFTKALAERHPVPLMILYSLHVALQLSLIDMIRLAQLFLVLLLAFSAWWFLGHKMKLDFGLIVFLLSVFSVTTTVGFYSSILANWMALVVWVLFFAYLTFRSEGKLGAIDFLVLLFLSTMILFIHPWTWGVFATAVLVAAIIALVQEKRKDLRNAGLLLAVIAFDVVLALVTISYLGSSQGWRVLDAIGDYTFAINNPSSILEFWDALTWLTRIWSPFFSPLYIAVSIAGVFSLGSAPTGPWGKRLIYGWLFVSAVGSILVAPVGFNTADPSGSETQLWRLLYITPFFVLAPLGITWTTRIACQGLYRDETSRETRDLNLALVGVVLVVSLGVALAFANMWERAVLLLFLSPAVIAGILMRSQTAERKFFNYLIVAIFALVALNNTTRALSQLLRSPHNYRPKVSSPRRLTTVPIPTDS